MPKKSTLLICLIFLIPSCLDKFDFERPDSIKGAVSIQGKLTKGNPSKVQVILKDVFDFFNSPKFLTAGKVFLIDEAGNELSLGTKRQGFFNLIIPNDHPYFKVEYGQKYKIRIENLKGQTFESDFDELLPAPIPNGFYAEEATIEYLNQAGKEETYDQLHFFVDTPLKAPNQSQNSRILWELTGVSKITDTPGAGVCNVPIEDFPKTCYVGYPPPRNYITYDGSNASGDRIDNYSLNESNYTNLYAEGYYMVLSQQGVSEEAYNYWSRVGTAVERTGDVFQAPAGKVSTNLYNLDNPEQEVFGFFYASEEYILRYYISPERGRNQKLRCPLVLMDGSQADFCCDCLTLENSTDEKPDWWTE